MKIYSLVLTLFFTTFYHQAISQHDAGFIYGKVKTVNNNTYIGQIRWGNEEIFWTDIFNSVKTYGRKIQVRIETEEDNFPENEKKEEYRWEILKIWDDQYSGQVHQFTCRFGDIKSIEPQEESEVLLTFKNDQKVRVKGGSNDVGAIITVYDYEIGKIDISWSDIKAINFFDTPRKVEDKPGLPIYGTVSTPTEKLSGLIAWDNDERIDTDQLDGELNQNNIHLQFKEIHCLKKEHCGTSVELITGNKIILTGTNDVNCSNRGIFVTLEDIGKVEVPWSQFLQLCLDSTHEDSGPPYRSYGQPKRLSGTVKIINKESVKGTIVFDKDEIWDFEQLEGKTQELRYIIPFRNIKKISPKNYEYSEVTLRNGKVLILGNSQDVSSSNEGVMILKNDYENPVVVDWMEIDEIIFD